MVTMVKSLVIRRKHNEGHIFRLNMSCLYSRQNEAQTHALLCRIQKVLQELPSSCSASSSSTTSPCSLFLIPFLLSYLQCGARLRSEQRRQGSPGLQPPLASSSSQSPVALSLRTHQVPKAAGGRHLWLPLALVLAPVRLEEPGLNLRYGPLVALYRLGPEIQERPAAELYG